MQKYITKTLCFENFMVTKSGFDAINIIGYGNTRSLDLHKDVMMKGAFEKALKHHRNAGTLPNMFFEHKKQILGGKWDKVEEDAYGLRVEGSIQCNSLDLKETKKIIDLILAGDLCGLSIGFYVDASDIELRNGIRYINTVKKLVEISLVKCPANAESRFVPTDIDVSHRVGAKPPIYAYSEQRK